VLVVDNPKQCLHRLQLVIGRLPLNQLDDGAANAPYVRRRRGARELNNLGGHPVRSAHDTRLVQARLLGGDAEVGELDQALLGGEDVGAFDVAVDDTLLVEVEEAVQDLGHVEGNEVFGELAKVLADAVQRAILTVPGER